MATNDARPGGLDPRHRVVARPAFARRAPCRPHALRAAVAGTAGADGGGLDGRRAGRRARDVAPRGLYGDAKLSNTGFTSEGSLKLLEFGLARETNNSDTLGRMLRYNDA